MNKNLKYALIALPLLFGGYLIVRSYRKSKQVGETLPTGQDIPTSATNVNTSGGITPTINKYFPLKKGSKGQKVLETQQAILAVDKTLLPKYGADSDFGSETEAAVYKLIKKKTIDSQDDIAKILAVKATAEAAQKTAEINAERKELADKLVSMWNKNKALVWNPIHDTQVNIATLTSDGREVNAATQVFKQGTFIRFNSGTTISVSNAGMILAKTDTGKLYRFSPYGFELISK